jgi:hypothetical protein
MKSADEFWNVIGAYNLQTTGVQLLFSALLWGLLLFSFFSRKQWVSNALKSLMGVLFLFVGIWFFLIVDHSVTAIIFGPYFIGMGCLFFWELLQAKESFRPPTTIQYMLYSLTLSYPLVSYLIGHYYPQQVFYIMPCPLVALALITYCRLRKRNDLLNILLILWGLTGVKAFIFDVKEDLILLIVGIFGLIDYIQYRKGKYIEATKTKQQ